MPVTGYDEDGNARGFGVSRPFNEASPQPRAILTARMTGEANIGSNHRAAEVEVTLTMPDGRRIVFDSVVSGGWGEYGNQSYLPGLCRDLNGRSSVTNARYELDWQSLCVNKEGVGSPSGVLADNGRLYWLRLFSNREETDRGMSNPQDGSGAFGFHADGGAPGSLGCLVFQDEREMRQFFSLMQSLPIDQRPSTLNVVPPSMRVPTPQLAQELVS
jgi:hypothetical protein